MKLSRPAAYLAVSTVGRHMALVAVYYLILTLLEPTASEDPAPPTTQESS